jgi:hypothetical protein
MSHDTNEEKKLYLTKQTSSTDWYYIGDPLNPHTTMDTGIVKVEDKSEIRIDEFGAYVVRIFSSTPPSEVSTWEERLKDDFINNLSGQEPVEKLMRELNLNGEKRAEFVDYFIYEIRKINRQVREEAKREVLEGMLDIQQKELEYAYKNGHLFNASVNQAILVYAETKGINLISDNKN